MRVRGKFAILAALAVTIAALAATAFATTATVGTVPAAIGTQCGIPVDIIQTGNPAYVVPSGTWTVTSWSTRGIVTAGMRLAVFQSLGGSSYQVMAVSPTETSVAGVVNTFHTPMTVHGGEILGMWGDTDVACGGAGTGTIVAAHSLSPATVGDVVSGFATIPAVVADVQMTLNSVSAGGSDTPGPHEGYCMAQPVLRADGTTGVFVSLDAGQGETDPAYKGATPALFGQSYGITCDNLALKGFTDAGYKVNGSGARTGTSADLYEYFTKP
ncbi:MAG TPA: hypothetical protein VFW85_00470 [Gaiellaceae bacterium]|nr:hypothetical protein [Gaiellaceae bacterium]